MRRYRARSGAISVALALSLALAAPAAGPARAQGADHAAGARPDSLDEYLRALADSTDRYFDVAAAPAGTAGLDSALAYRLAHPEPRPSRRGGLRAGPWFSFDRAEGALWGGVLGWGRVDGPGDL